jgi:hypothetical protein
MTRIWMDGCEVCRISKEILEHAVLETSLHIEPDDEMVIVETEKIIYIMRKKDLPKLGPKVTLWTTTKRQ